MPSPTTPTPTPTPVVIDCDPGHDDAIAIMLAAGDPDIDLPYGSKPRAHHSRWNAPAGPCPASAPSPASSA
jgi:hypothetical protein